MNAFDELLKIADRLLGPGGCAWDRSQTIDTLKPYILEETHELLEAVDLMDKERIEEELVYPAPALAQLRSQRSCTPQCQASLMQSSVPGESSTRQAVVRQRPCAVG